MRQVRTIVLIRPAYAIQWTYHERRLRERMQGPSSLNVSDDRLSRLERPLMPGADRPGSGRPKLISHGRIERTSFHQTCGVIGDVVVHSGRLNRPENCLSRRHQRVNALEVNRLATCPKCRAIRGDRPLRRRCRNRVSPRDNHGDDIQEDRPEFRGDSLRG